jgi:hypothetical protein
MFNNGGMVSPPEQATGILASSPSLVDAVSNDALSNMGGGTLSMAQGGIAKFQDGGIRVAAPEGMLAPKAETVSRDPTDFYSQISGLLQGKKTVGGSSGFLPLRYVDTTISEIINETPRERYDRLFPVSVDPSSMQSYDEGPPSSRLNDLLGKFAIAIKSGASTAGDVLGDVYDYGLTKEGASKSFSHINAINTMIRRRPDLQKIIENMSNQVLEKEPNISANALEEKIAEAVHVQKEDLEGYKEGSVESQAGMGAVGDAGAQEYLDTQPYREQSEELAQEFLDKQAGMGAVGEGFTPGETILDPTRMDASNFQGMVPDTSYVGPNENELVDQGGGVDIWEGIPVEEAGPAAKVPGTEVKPGQKPPAPGGLPADASQKANQTIKQIQAAAEAGKPEDVKKGLEDYVAEFKAAMPEYEGKTDFESGMDFVKMGMAIAAGQSPNAIENISKGVLGTIDNFTSDEKEKRAYKRQVALSGAKYALQKVAKDEERAFALAKEGRGLKTVFAVQDVLNPDGSLKAQKGTSFFITNDEIHSGVYDGQFEAGTTLAVERLKANAKKGVSLLRNIIGQTRKGGPSDKLIQGRIDKYTTDATEIGSLATQIALIDSSAKINNQGQAVGLGPYLARKVNATYNAFNIERKDDGSHINFSNLTDEKIDKADISDVRKNRFKAARRLYEKLDKKQLEQSLTGSWANTGRESERFLAQQQEIANLLIKEILGEGSKNVSNIDRQLASEIVGLYTGFSSITADPAIIGERLNRIRNRVLTSYERTRTSMRGIETQLSKFLERDEKTLASERLKPIRRDALSAASRGLGNVGRQSPKQNLGGYKGSKYKKETVDGVVRYVFK